MFLLLSQPLAHCGHQHSCSTSEGLVEVLVCVCIGKTGTSTTVGAEGYGTGSGTGMDMSLAQVLVLLWAQQGHWCQFWRPVGQESRHNTVVGPVQAPPAQHWYQNGTGAGRRVGKARAQLPVPVPTRQGLQRSTGASKLCLLQGFLLAGVTAALVPHLVYRSESQRPPG